MIDNQNKSGTGEIEDNDEAKISIVGGSVNEGDYFRDPNGPDLAIAVTMEGPIQGSITVIVTALNAPASPVNAVYGRDYYLLGADQQQKVAITFSETDFRFGPSVSKNVWVRPNGEITIEKNEVFTVEVSIAPGIGIGTEIVIPTDTVTILNDDFGKIQVYPSTHPSLDVPGFFQPLFAETSGSISYTAMLIDSDSGDRTNSETGSIISVNYSVSNGTTSGNDFSGTTSGVVRLNPTTPPFGPGETIGTFEIALNDDAIVERHETFSINIDTPVGENIVGSVAIGLTDNIIESEDTAIITINNVSINAGGTLVFSVFTSATIQGGVGIDYVTIPGSGLGAAQAVTSATPLGDFFATSGTLTLVTGSQAIDVLTVADADTSDETFTVHINNLAGGFGELVTFGNTSGTGTINP
jgi:hypothetical protein